MEHERSYELVVLVIFKCEHRNDSCMYALNIILITTFNQFKESFVWKMYQERCWDFFPAGDCFRKQYEDQLG